MKRHAPATARNSEPIAKVLESELPPSGTVLEIASGTGEHAVFFARCLPDLTWQPSDADPEALASVEAWRADGHVPNLLPPMKLDASAADWPAIEPEAIVCINMVHIAPWSAAEGLFAAAGRLLGEGEPLILYGPFIDPEAELAPSNADFDASLKTRDPEWGLRDIRDLDTLAAHNLLARTARYEMPANNLVLVWRKL